jgi:hypothetical protein
MIPAPARIGLAGFSVPTICAGGCFKRAPKSAVTFKPQIGVIMLAPGLGRGLNLAALTALFLLFSPLLTYPVAFAQAPIAKPGTEGLEVIVSITGPVIASYQGYNSSFYSNDLYLMLDASGNPGDDGCQV